jgi:hypothetical protein
MAFQRRPFLEVTRAGFFVVLRAAVFAMTFRAAAFVVFPLLVGTIFAVDAVIVVGVIVDGVIVDGESLVEVVVDDVVAKGTVVEVGNGADDVVVVDVADAATGTVTTGTVEADVNGVVVVVDAVVVVVVVVVADGKVTVTTTGVDAPKETVPVEAASSFADVTNGSWVVR